MPNALMMRYAATRGNDDERMDRRRNEMPDEMRRREQDGGRMNGYEQPGMAYSEYHETGMRQPYRHTRGDYDGAESRYRGRDGRWKAGRRSEYEGGRTGNMPYDRRRAGGDDDEDEDHEYNVTVTPSNVIEWPYADPDTMPSSRRIGFGAENNMGMHHNEGHTMGRAGSMEFDRETAENWVRNMRNEDKAHPVGGKWSPDMLKPLAQKYGIPTDGNKFWELYAMANAMYSDYGEVARKFGVTSPEFYVCMAKAWMEDKDAEPDKTALYYEHIVKK